MPAAARQLLASGRIVSLLGMASPRKILTSLCSVPTAPFVEGRVVEFVEDFVRQRPKLRLSRDEHGNLLIELPAKKRGPRWIFAAHMDHPGFVTRGMADKRHVRCDFRGGVHADYVKGCKVVFFDGDREIRGKVTDVQAEAGAFKRARETVVRVKEPVAAGIAGMFDQGEGRTKGRRFLSRVCDNLAGAAAALAMLDDLLKNAPEAPVAVLLTRGEEEGFVGAIAAAMKPKLLKKTDRLIIIECSAQQPHAPQKKGPIIRVGDRTSIFNSSLTYFLTQQAEESAKRSKRFQFQRALMPGGTCEATVYDVYGFHAASICIALGNYHNMDRDREKIGPEYIDLDDWENMVRLFVAIARAGHTYREGHKALRQRLEKRFRGLRKLL